MSAHLLKNITKYLDPHLALMILEDYEKETFIDSKIIAQEKVNVLSKTQISDYTIGDLKKLKTAGPSAEIDKLIEAAESQKKEAAKTLAVYKKYSENFVSKVVEDEDKYKELEKEKFNKVAYFKVFPNIESFAKEDLDFALKYARILYDIGKYEDSNKILNCLQALYEDEETIISILWGKLLSEILLESFNEAHETVKLLRDKLEKEREKASHMQVLASRINFLHTCLFFYMRERYSDESLDFLIDIFSRETYMNAIQVGAPHLVRYLLSFFFLLKSSPKFDLHKLNSLLPYFKPDVANYSDALSQFTLALLEDFDFKKAQSILKNFKKELHGDHFLHKHIDTIINNAQTIFFEVFCKIYRKIEIKMVAEFLEVDKEQAEIWIVNLIRNADFEAKVDPTNGVINLVSNHATVYEQVLNKTRDLLPRTNILINNITRILKSND